MKIPVNATDGLDIVGRCMAHGEFAFNLTIYEHSFVYWGCVNTEPCSELSDHKPEWIRDL
jgi:hypothetical protein